MVFSDSAPFHHRQLQYHKLFLNAAHMVTGQGHLCTQGTGRGGGRGTGRGRGRGRGEGWGEGVQWDRVYRQP